MAETLVSKEKGNLLETETAIDDAFAEIANTLPLRDRNVFSEHESRVLELYDRLEDIRLERMLVETEMKFARGQYRYATFRWAQCAQTSIQNQIQARQSRIPTSN